MNNIVNSFGNLQNLKSQFDSFVKNFNQTNITNLTPQQMVQNMLNSGQMSQQQFNELRSIANQITGKNI